MSGFTIFGFTSFIISFSRIYFKTEVSVRHVITWKHFIKAGDICSATKLASNVISEPGISGTIREKLNGLVQIVNYVSMSYKNPGRKFLIIPAQDPVVMKNRHCRIRHIILKAYSSSHKHHCRNSGAEKLLNAQAAILRLFRVHIWSNRKQPVFSCHFKKSDDPRTQIW